MKLVELYSEKQGRPLTKQVADMGSSRPVFITLYVTKEEFESMQTELREQLEEQTTVLEQALLELKQMKLHLASLSQEDIKEDDVE